MKLLTINPLIKYKINKIIKSYTTIKEPNRYNRYGLSNNDLLSLKSEIRKYISRFDFEEDFTENPTFSNFYYYKYNDEDEFDCDIVYVNPKDIVINVSLKDDELKVSLEVNND